MVPVSGSDVFLLPGTPVAQGFAGGDLKFFWLSTRYPQRRLCCPPEQALFHQAIHNFLHRRLAEARLVDELRVHLSPLVLGDGTRLFDLVGPTRLVQREVIKSPRVTHLTYEVIRD